MTNPLFTAAFKNGDSAGTATELPTIVQVRESSDTAWNETTTVTAVSRNSAGFCLSRPCVVGRLISLVLAMPDEFRAYDKGRDLYPVTAIVESCYKATVDGKVVYQVRVGLTGKHEPESFTEDPCQSYRIVGMRSDGLWRITEADEDFKSRGASRFSVTSQVTVSFVRKGELAARPASGKEVCFTKDISASGVQLPCNLRVTEGEKVKVEFKKHDFQAIAIVRSRKESKGKVPILHLEFIDQKFPIERILLRRRK